MSITRSKRFLPVFSVALGVMMLIAQAIGGHPGQGLLSLGIMTVFGALVRFGGRSETLRGLRGDGRDERFAQIDLRATAFAGLAITIAVIVGFVIEVARGHEGTPYMYLGAIGGLAYIAAIVWQRLRG